MNIEYSFTNAGIPFHHSYKCNLDSTLDFSKGLYLNHIIEILKQENVNVEQIASIYYYRRIDKTWVILDSKNKIINGNNLKLKIVMTKSNSDTLLINMLNQLKIEAQSLRETFQYIVNQQNIPNNINIKDTLEELIMNKSVSYDTSITLPRLKEKSNLINQSSLIVPSNNIGRREIDIAYLYAVPIVKEDKKKLIPLSNPIDASKEMESILAELKTNNKEVVIRINVGTLDRLRSSIAMRPKILHISCHGGYELKGGIPKLYLYLERNEMNGVVEKYDVNTFRQWFQAEIKGEVCPRLVFVSACYSQEFGEAMRQAGVPNVIAINSDTQVADEAATRFAKVLYHYLTLGMSVKEAFEQTRKDGKVSLRKLKLCCCTHNHKTECGLLTELIRNRDEAHAIHLPECSCDFGGNIHLKTCSWVTTMSDLSYEVKPVKDNSRKVRVCCCNPDLPHNEEEKFILISQSSELQEERLFENLLESEPIVLRCFDPVVLSIVDEQLIGRNIELHRLLTLLISTSYECRIISVNGPKGVGKTLLVKTGAKYAIERGIFPDGVVIVDLHSLTWVLSKLNAALLPSPHKEAHNLSELGLKVKNMQKIVIIHCSDVVEKSPLQLIKYLHIVLAEGSRIKFILIGKKKMNEEYAVNLTIEEDLTPLSAFKIIKHKNPDWSHTYGNFETTDLARILVTPWLAKKAAYMLKTDSPDEVYIKLLKKKLVPQADENGNHDEYVKSEEGLFNAFNNCCEEIMPIYILAQLRFGVLESDLQRMCEDEFGKWKEKAKDFITERNEVQTIVLCSWIEEIKERRYKLTEVASRYVNEYLLSKSEGIRYQIVCLEFLSSMIRKIVRSYNVNVYKRLKHNEFTAIIDEAIWSSSTTELTDNSLVSDPIIRFNLAKDNFMLYLDSNKLQEIANEVSNVDVDMNKVIHNAKELAICTFTMLLHVERPQEAMEIADSMQSFATNQEINPHYKRIHRHCHDIIGMMQLVKGGMTLKKPDIIGTKDALKQAEEAEGSFRIAENDIGVGEALFLQGLLLATEQDKRKYAPAVFQDAKTKFDTYPVGIARVNIAEASLLIDASDEHDEAEYIEQLLAEALKILSVNEHYINMQSKCYYLKAMCAERCKNYDVVRENLLISLDKARVVGNSAMETMTIAMLNHSSTCMQQDYPLFVFLNSFPVVKKLPNEPAIVLEPFIRKQNVLKSVILEYVENKHLAIKIHFDTLTRDNIKQAMIKSCILLHITSTYYSQGILAFEGVMGELDEMGLFELKELLANHIKVSQCKLVVIMLPNSGEIAQIFSDLGVPHVICFRLSPKYFLKYKGKIPAFKIYELVSNIFSQEFYKLLVCGETIQISCDKALKLSISTIKNIMKSFGIKDFIIEEYNIAFILPLDSDKSLHNEKLMPIFKYGKYIETSTKRGVCDIEKERKPLIGRQLEFFKMISALKENKCINLYGHTGVGKTKLVKEVGYFLYLRSWFLSGIYYRVGMQQLCNPKYFVPLEVRSNKNSNALFIVDNSDQSTWKRAGGFFYSMKKKHNCLFILISQEPLVLYPEFNIITLKLKSLNKKESIEYIRMYLDYLNPTVNNHTFQLSQFKREIIHSMAFIQAHGYPKLLRLLCRRLVEGLSVSSINLLEEARIGFYYKRIIRKYAKNFTPLPEVYYENSYRASRDSELDEPQVPIIEDIKSKLPIAIQEPKNIDVQDRKQSDVIIKEADLVLHSDEVKESEPDNWEDIEIQDIFNKLITTNKSHKKRTQGINKNRNIKRINKDRYIIKRITKKSK